MGELQVTTIRSTLSPRWWRHPIRWWRFRRITKEDARRRREVPMYAELSDEIERRVLFGEQEGSE